MPSPRGLVWSSLAGGSKQEYLGAALAQQTSPKATARVTMLVRMAPARGVWQRRGVGRCGGGGGVVVDVVVVVVVVVAVFIVLVVVMGWGLG